MSVTRIASRYAKSLLELATEQKALDNVVGDIEGFEKIADNRDFALMLKSPIILTDKKVNIFNAIFEGKVYELTLAFYHIILRKGREALLPDIANEFVRQYKNLKQISEVSLTTAGQLSEASLNAIKAKLAESSTTMAEVDLKTEIDASILGGYILEIGDKKYDASIKHKLDNLRKEFADNDYVSKI